MPNILPTSDIKTLLTSCHKAKRITELQPPLPPGLTPANLKVLDCIDLLYKQDANVKVSDIATAMQVTRPNITRLVKELEKIGAVSKTTAANDGRVSYLQLTSFGRELHSYYIAQYHNWLSQHLTDISANDIAVTAATITKLYNIMSSQKPQLTGAVPQTNFIKELKQHE